MNTFGLYWVIVRMLREGFIFLSFFFFFFFFFNMNWEVRGTACERLFECFKISKETVIKLKTNHNIEKERKQLH